MILVKLARHCGGVDWPWFAPRLMHLNAVSCVALFLDIEGTAIVLRFGKQSPPLRSP